MGLPRRRDLQALVKTTDGTQIRMGKVAKCSSGAFEDRRNHGATTAEVMSTVEDRPTIGNTSGSNAVRQSRAIGRARRDSHLELLTRNWEEVLGSRSASQLPTAL